MEETKKRTRKATVAKETKTAEKASTAKKAAEKKNVAKKSAAPKQEVLRIGELDQYLFGGCASDQEKRKRRCLFRCLGTSCEGCPCSR